MKIRINQKCYSQQILFKYSTQTIVWKLGISKSIVTNRNHLKIKILRVAIIPKSNGAELTKSHALSGFITVNEGSKVRLYGERIGIHKSR